MHIPRRHLNYANVVATLALVFAMSGGALAAKHYLINSTKQINPKVLKKLKGNTGKTGAIGPQGKEGPAGKEGLAGKEGAAGAGPAFSAFHDPDVALTKPGLQPVVSLSNVPAGDYWEVATFEGFNASGSAVDVECVLNSFGDSDTKHFLLQANGGSNVDDESVSMQVVHVFSGASNTVTLECNPFGVSGLEIGHIKITAVRVS